MVELGMLVLFDAADRRRFSLFFSEFSRFSHVFAIGCASSWGYFSSSLSLLFPFSFRMGKLVFEFRRAYWEFIPTDGKGWTVFSFSFGRVRCICVGSVEFLMRKGHRCRERTKRTSPPRVGIVECWMKQWKIDVKPHLGSIRPVVWYTRFEWYECHEFSLSVVLEIPIVGNNILLIFMCWSSSFW